MRALLLVISLVIAGAVVAQSQQPTPSQTKGGNEPKGQAAGSPKQTAVVRETTQNPATKIALPVAPNAEKNPPIQRTIRTANRLPIGGLLSGSWFTLMALSSLLSFCNSYG